MTKSQLIAALGVLTLAGCSHFKYVDLPDPSQPRVTVVDGRISVVPEILVFNPGQRDLLITWKLPAESKLRFADRGIVIEGSLTEKVREGSVVLDKGQSEVVNCRRSENRMEYSCQNRHLAPGILKYTIRVMDSSKELERDPFIVNM